MVRSGTRLVMAVAVVTLLGVAGCSGGTDKAGGRKPVPTVVLHVLYTFDPVEVRAFVDKVAELSGGALRLARDEKWGLDSTISEAETIRAVQAGGADLAIVPARAWHDLGVRSFDALIAPLAVDTMTLQAKVLSSDLPGWMLAGVTPLGLTGIGILPGPMRKPAGITRSLLGPSDYRRTTIGFNRSAVADHSLRALGATPVVSAFRGADIARFDGVEQQVASVAGNPYERTVRSITGNVNLWPRPLVVVANAKGLQRLSAEQVSWLRSAGREAVGGVAQTQLGLETEGLGQLCRRGGLHLVSATAGQIGQLRSAFEPVHAWLREDRQTSRFLDEIAALRAGGVRPFPQESLTCAGVTPAGDTTTSASSPPSAPFDGTYQMVTTEQEARESDPNPSPENWGDWIFIFGRGRFAITQENAAACTWGYGTYVVTEQRVEWRFIDGGGIAPTGAQNKPGEDFLFGWSRYHDTMMLTPVAGAISPQNFWAKPWHRLSATPSGSYLSKRCPPPAEATRW
jgi:TRAP-type C4-dicarboxylate transport system substrate-binding protein